MHAVDDAALLIGVDFSSRPTPRKPVVVACGRTRDGDAGAHVMLDGDAGEHVMLDAVVRFPTLQSFGRWLQATPRWIGGFDLPFGLPRELVEQLGWPTPWPACMDHYTALARPAIRDTFAAFCAARPVGAKFAHRACDRPAGSSPSMKWVNPPVAYMLHAGVPLLRAAGAHLPAHEAVVADAPRIALEAYPGLLAREIVGARSYKSDDIAKHDDARLLARLALVDALREGHTRLGVALDIDAAQHDALVDDASGDTLDAVLCLLQAAWAARRPRFGLPAQVDALEGWIVSA